MDQSAERLSKGNTWIREIGQELRLQAPFVILVAVFVALVASVAHLYGLEGLFQMTLYSKIMYILAVVSATISLLTYAGYLAFVEKERRPARRMFLYLRTHVFTASGLIGILIPLLTMQFILSAFSSFKNMIPNINPFHWDGLFYKLDRWLHFGISPWQATHFLFGDTYSTLVINFLYNFWIFVGAIYLFCSIFRSFGVSESVKYILGFVLCWAIIGSGFAFLLSSGGPVYYGRLTGLEDVYAPLMDRLHAINGQLNPGDGYWRVWALDTQEHLWEQYQNAATTIGSGISAMPSMHVSIATLMALSARRIGRWFGRVMMVYAVIIMIGSVHLGWHYAVDGYLAFILTVLIWKLADRVIDWVIEKPSTS